MGFKRKSLVYVFPSPFPLGSAENTVLSQLGRREPTCKSIHILGRPVTRIFWDVQNFPFEVLLSYSVCLNLL